MKVDLTKEAVEALNAVWEEVKKRHELIHRSQSGLASRLIIFAREMIRESDYSTLAQSLQTPVQKRKALLKQLEKLTQQVSDEVSIKSLEKSIKKLSSTMKNADAFSQ